MKNFLFASLIASPLGVAAQTLINEPALSANAAIEVARAALAHCRREGQKVTVSVVDHAGRPKVTILDDGAAPHSVEHAFRKAYTALTYKMPSADYGKRVAEAKSSAIGPQLLPNLTTAAGGVPIRSGNNV